ncbi:MAG: molybdopterin-dependent oxidoreductase [Planctomycetes bacterium]|nr:molybdopterin-dependent oxidoreductase [Planctomycetota bacterium]
MTDDILLRVDGEVDQPAELSLADLSAIDAAYQVADAGTLSPSRRGVAVSLEGLLLLVGVRPSAKFITLHASADDFHASVPLEAVRGQGYFVYRLGEQPLPASDGGPVRFFIPDPDACQVGEVDECANVKFLDHVELTEQRGHDNRPTDEEQHAKLHESQGGE